MKNIFFLRLHIHDYTYNDILQILNFQYPLSSCRYFSKYYIYMKNNFCNTIFVFLELSNVIFYIDFFCHVPTDL